MELKTAADSYAERKVVAENLLRAIKAELRGHAERAAKEQPGNWAAAGDLGLVCNQLRETLAFLQGK